MTENKKLRILQEYIDKGLAHKDVIHLRDIMDKERIVRDKLTISDLYDKVKNGEDLDQFPNFKDIFKSIDKGKIITLDMIYKDTFEKYLKGIEKEKKIGSPDDAYNKEFKENKID